MNDVKKEKNEGPVLRERYDLAMERIRQIPNEHFGAPAFERYFAAVAEFLLLLDDTGRFLAEGGLEKAPLEELQCRNHALYEDVLPGHYETSFGNPEYAVKELGEELGALLSYLYVKMRGNIEDVYERDLESQVVRLELFVQVYTAFTYQWEENGQLPEAENIRLINYWSVTDYAEETALRRVKSLLDTEDNFAVEIVRNSDLDDVRYLYTYGEYVSENELETARFLAGLDEETIAIMASIQPEH